MPNEQAVAAEVNRGLKHFIIGKFWINSIDGTRPGAVKISRNLPRDIVLKAGTTLFLNNNKKREGKTDADYNVSVLLPTAIADKLIQATIASAANISAGVAA